MSKPIRIEAPKLPITLRYVQGCPHKHPSRSGVVVSTTKDCLRIQEPSAGFATPLVFLDPAEEEHLREILNLRAMAAIDAVGKK